MFQTAFVNASLSSSAIQRSRTVIAATLLVLLTACGGKLGGDSSSNSGVVQRNTAPAISPSPAPEATPSAERQAIDLEISWSAPIARTDGSALNTADIVGYELHAIDSQSGDSERHTLSGATATQITLQNLRPSNYELYLFVYDSNNNISEPAVFNIDHRQFPEA